MKIFQLPDLGEGLAEAEVREWYVKEGDTVTVDQPLLSMETAKAVVDVPSPYAGRITKLHGQPGEFIQTHAPLVEFEGDANAPQKEKDKGSVVGSLEETAHIIDEGDVIIGGSKTKTQTSVRVMPAVRALANQLEVDLQSIQGSGPGGQITADDVKTAASHPAVKMEILHGVRHFMAKAMSRSLAEVVPVTICDDADITDLPKDADLTYYFIQAIVAGAKAEPALNAWYEGKTLARHLHNEVNLGLAVDTPEGLFVPVLKDVANKSLDILRQEINAFKQGAKDRTLSPEQLQGATISLSNFGVFAGRYASLTIMPPTVAILGCGKVRDVVLPKDGNILIRRIVPLSLSFDHRAVTGGEGSRFLAAVINYLQEKR